MIKRCFQRQVWHRTLLPIKGRLHLKVTTKPDTDAMVQNPVWNVIYMDVFGSVTRTVWNIREKRTVSRSMEVING